MFERVLDQKINAKKFLNDIEIGKISFVDSIQNNEMLWGILLGYGRHNASLYNRRERQYFKAMILSDVALRKSKIKLKPCGDYNYSPLIMGSVHFASDPEHPETRSLEKKYKVLRGKISSIYAKGDFLEITLSQLTGLSASDCLTYANLFR